MLSTAKNGATNYFIIIVHYGPIDGTQAFIDNISQSDITNHTVIIIDNSSTFPSSGVDKNILCIRPSKNEGFAAGSNIGLGVLASRGAKLTDRVIVANNDLNSSSDVLAAIDSWWEHQSDSDFLAGPQGGRLNKITGRARLTKRFPCDYLDGALVVGTYDVWLQLKGLPDQYFLYWEDVAFGQRARERGIPLKIIPELQLHHLSAGSPDKLYYLVRNGAHFLEHGSSPLWRYYWQVRNYLRRLYHYLAPASPTRTIILQALADARQGILGKKI